MKRDLLKVLSHSIALVTIGLLSFSLLAENFPLGGVAPYGAPDQELNAADVLILEKMILGEIIPTEDEIKLGDVAPLNNVDGVLNAGDLIVQQRAVLGQISLGTIDIVPAPKLIAGLSPTTDNPYLITGTATANSTVEVYVESTLYNVMVAADGTFTTSVYLYDGLNNIYAIENNEGEISSPSNTLLVQYNNVIDRDGLPTNISVNTVWTPGTSPQPYIISSTLTINAGVSLIIQPGTELKFELGAGIVVNGDLIVLGTSQNIVRFTSNSNPALMDDWNGIQVNSDANLSLDFAIIEYASDGIYFSNSGGNISNSLIQKNDTGILIIGDSFPIIGQSNVINDNLYGIKLQGQGGVNPLPSITGNQIYSNNYYNIHATSYTDGDNNTVNVRDNYWGSVDIKTIYNNMYKVFWPLSFESFGSVPIIDYGDFLDESGASAVGETLTGRISLDRPLSPGTTYDLLGPIRVSAGSTLSIPPGVTIRSSDHKMCIYIDGIMTVSGSADNQVTFTTTESTPSWVGIKITDGGYATFDYAFIEDAAIAIAFESGSSGSVTNSWLVGNGEGISIRGDTSPYIDSNVISNNTYGILISADDGVEPTPTITNNDIYNNSWADLQLEFIQSETPLAISGNWWGTEVIADIRAKIRTLGPTADPTIIVPLDSISATPTSFPVVTTANTPGRYISPVTSIGTNDTSSFFIRFSYAADWTVDVINTSSQQVVKTFSGSNSVFTTIVWDGKDEAATPVPDGAYEYSVSAGGMLRQNYSVFVDNTLPTALFSDGMDGTIITSPTLLFNGTAQDDSFFSYIVEYGAGAAPLTWTEIEAISFSQVSNSYLANWLLTNDEGQTPPLSGINTIRLTVIDKAGNAKTQSIMVTVNVVSIYDVTHDQTTINPVKAEVSTVSFTLGIPATVTLNIIKDLDGSLVRSIINTFSTAGPKSLPWDGKDGSGNYVENEAYTYTLEADDGTYQANYIPTTLSNINGVSSSITAIDFDVSKNEFFNIPLNLNGLGLARLSFCVHPNSSLSINCDTAGAIKIIDNKPFENGLPVQFYWDGRDLSGSPISSSNYRYYFKWPSPLLQNTILVKGTAPFVHGDAAAPAIEVKSNPYLVHHSFEEFSQIKYQVDQDSTVTAKLLPPGINDPNDPTAITLLSNKPVVADVIETLTWMGYLGDDTNNILVSDEGLYTFTIEATSDITGFTTLYRGALTLNQ